MDYQLMLVGQCIASLNGVKLKSNREPYGEGLYKFYQLVVLIVVVKVVVLMSQNGFSVVFQYHMTIT